jgi:hypothetical protein
MLIIRPEQLEVFKPVAEVAFRRRVVDYLQENHPQVAVQLPNGITTINQIPEEIIHKMVENGIEKARSYGMTWESSLTSFVVLMFVAAPNFDEHPLIQRGLRDESVEVDSRINKLWDRTSEQNWEAVKEKYDANAWRFKPQEGGH